MKGGHRGGNRDHGCNDGSVKHGSSYGRGSSS